MNLDSLFQQVLLTEKHVSENTRQLHEVIASTINTQEEMKCLTEKLEFAYVKREETAQRLSEAKLELHLAKKQREQLEKKQDNLKKEQGDFTQELEQVRRASIEEREAFMKEITTFNSNYNLLTDRDTVFQRQTRAEMQSLQMKANTLKQEMEVMKQKNSQLVAMTVEQGFLEAKLDELQRQATERDMDLEEAQALTEHLKAESLAVRQKPLTDSTCLRLKKELETCKDGELDLLYEALSTEIQFLHSKLSQKKASVC